MGLSERASTYVRGLYTTVLSSIPGTARRSKIRLTAGDFPFLTYIFFGGGACIDTGRAYFTRHTALHDKAGLMTPVPRGVLVVHGLLTSRRDLTDTYGPRECPFARYLGTWGPREVDVSKL